MSLNVFSWRVVQVPCVQQICISNCSFHKNYQYRWVSVAAATTTGNEIGICACKVIMARALVAIFLNKEVQILWNNLKKTFELYPWLGIICSCPSVCVCVFACILKFETQTTTINAHSHKKRATCECVNMCAIMYASFSAHTCSASFLSNF